jgi:ATP-dependent Clp protease ATP-binding subunit ClpA
MFAGSTGCGKTEMAKAIHDNLFGRPDLMLHVDLGEYKLKESLHKLIGVPKGYVGSDRPGVLSEFLQRTATGTLLFDEAEKAHPDVLHALLALCDEGRLRTGDGQLLDARHCVVILTTNAVRAQDLERKQIGFGAGHSRGSAEQLLRDSFPPELLDRMDAVVVFDQLGDDAMRSVVGLRLDEALQHLTQRDVRLEFDRDRLVEHLLGRLATRSGNGARGIQRILEEVLLQPVARAVLVAHGSGPDHFVLDDAFYSRGVVRHDSSPATGENLSCL